MTEVVENGLDGFGVEARLAVTLASAQASSLGSTRVGTEHLLLGLLAESDAGAARFLNAAGVTLAAARRKVAEAIGQRVDDIDSDATPGSVDVVERSPRAERALGRAFRFSRERQAPEVMTEHLLLGILDVEGTAGQVLRGLGTDIEALQAAVDAPPADDTADVVTGRRAKPRSGGTGADTGVLCASCSSPLQGSLDYSVLAARPAVGCGSSREVTIVSCRRCGAAVGIAR